MKHVSDFVGFDCEGFFKPKVMKVTQILPPNKDESDESVVARVEVVVLEDNSEYKISKYEADRGVSEVNNLYEKFFIKTTTKEGFSVGESVQPLNPSGKVYVSRENNPNAIPKLNVSLKCKGFVVIKDKKA